MQGGRGLREFGDVLPSGVLLLWQQMLMAAKGGSRTGSAQQTGNKSRSSYSWAATMKLAVKKSLRVLLEVDVRIQQGVAWQCSAPTQNAAGQQPGTASSDAAQPNSAEQERTLHTLRKQMTKLTLNQQKFLLLWVLRWPSRLCTFDLNPIKTLECFLLICLDYLRIRR